jgi:hypothetical protein
VFVGAIRDYQEKLSSQLGRMEGKLDLVLKEVAGVNARLRTGAPPRPLQTGPLEASGGKKFNGQISFRSGSKAAFNYFWSRFTGDKLPYSEILSEIKPGIRALDLPMLRLSNVSRIAFGTLSNEERTTMKEKELFNIRKAAVILRDGTTKEDIFLYVGETEWRGQSEEGNIQSDSVATITFDQAHFQPQPRVEQRAVGLASLPKNLEVIRSQVGKHRGTVSLKDGSTRPFIAIWSSMSGDEFPYSAHASDWGHGYNKKTPVLCMSEVARITWLELTPEDCEVLNDNLAWVRKATVLRKGKPPLESIFIYTALNSNAFGPDGEEYNFNDLDLVSIVSD